MRCTLLVPVYNEARSLALLMDQVTRLAPEPPLHFETLIVDDGSTDSTRKLVRPWLFSAKGEEDLVTPRPIKVIRHRQHHGLGQGLLSGLHYTLNRPYTKPTDWIATVATRDVGSLKHIPELIEMANSAQADVIIMSEPPEEDTWMSALSPISILQDGINMFLTSVFQLDYGIDMLTTLRLYRVSAIQDLIRQFGPQFIQEKGFTGNSELLVKLHWSGCPILTAPVSQPYKKKLASEALQTGEQLLGVMGQLSELGRLRDTATRLTRVAQGKASEKNTSDNPIKGLDHLYTNPASEDPWQDLIQ